MEELLDSLSRQSAKNFEVVIVEDGSQQELSSQTIVQQYSDRLDIQYHYKVNTGPGDTRNFGVAKAKYDYILLFDSDCVIPPGYIETVSKHLETDYVDLFGGPDSAHESFSNVQKAINYAMTSTFTTGGIRGGNRQLDNYQPRSFNMGISKEAYLNAGGFSHIHPGEDPDLSLKIMKLGYKSKLLTDAVVFHKRRIDFAKFRLQVSKFGAVRIIISKWHPGSFKIVYAFPALFLLGSLGLVALSLIFLELSWLFLSPLVIFGLLVFFDSLSQNRNLKIALLSVVASFVQLYGYGYGFLKALILVKLLGRNEERALPSLFFKKQPSDIPG